MEYLIGYVLIAIVLIPIFGRWAARDYRKNGGPRSYEMNATELAFVWGLSWPVIVFMLIVSGVVGFFDWLSRTKIIRKIVTGE